MIENLIHTLQSLKVGLKVVDGSLKINAPKGTLTPDIIEEIKAHKNALITLLSSSESIPKSEEKEYYALTSSQQRLWTLSQFDAGNTAYNIFNAFEFKGKLDIDKLSLAFNQLVNRHESLRTVFKEDSNGVLSQYIISIDEYKGALKFLDLNKATNDELKDHSTAMQKHVFDLERGPLFIGEIVKVADDRHILMFTMHHIIGDGWSMEILNKEFVYIYNELTLGKEAILPELPIQYKDYAEWQNTTERKSLLKKSQTFWLDTFSGELPVLELPSNKERPKLKTYNGSNSYHIFSREFSTLLNTYAQQNGMTLFMVLMSGINGLFSRYTNTRDIILGTPVAGREHTDLENQVGLYLNTLAIRTKFEETSTFEELLNTQKDTLLQAYTHQEYPFDSLVEELDIKRDVSRSVLFDTLVVFQNQQELLLSDELMLNEIEIDSYQNVEKSFSKFDLTFIFAEADGVIHVNLSYNTDIYTLNNVEQIIQHFENFLQIGITNPQIKIDTIDFLLEEEKQQILTEFNPVPTVYPKDKSVVDLFIDQVKETPDAIAIVGEKRSLTYRELDVISNQLANYITSSYTISNEEIISIELEKSDWFIISLLAVLKSGCAYLPVDINYPEERISYIRENSNCTITIDERLLTDFKSVKDQFSQDFTSEVSDLAYVIYTSGSTGKPKGVMVGQDSLINYISYQSKNYEIDQTDVILYFSNVAFDASIEQLFLALVNGASIVIASKEAIMDVTNFSNVLNTYEITHFHATPSYISQIQGIENCSSLKRIVCAGEVCPKELAVRLSVQVDFYNKYGPTETTISSTIYKYDADQYIGQSVPIGKPVSNTEIYIVSDAMELQPLGVVGEICISGIGLSRGYLNREDLTQEKFVINRFRESGILYKTGDLGRWLPDGNIEFIGRKDDQVKIRGYRIELGEIENTLIGLPLINQGVVTVQEVQSEQVLVAYYTSNEIINKQELRSSLHSHLPDYMVPSYYVELDTIPLTANGKVNKRALPSIVEEDVVKNEYVAPTTDLERDLVGIWEEVLGMDRIGITDNFFELGGHSLKVTLIANKIKKELGLEISIKDIFLNPTISGITSYVKEGAITSIPKAEEKSSYALTSSQRRLWVLSQLEDGSVAYNIPAVFELRGSIDTVLIQESFTQLITRHESLRTRFMRDASEEVRQYIVPSESVVFEVAAIDVSEVEDQKTVVRDIIDQNNAYCFDLSEAPLIKASLLKLGSEAYVLVLNMHHIISDGWSMEVLSKEFMMIYGSLVNGTSLALPELSIQYKDYAEWLESTSQEAALLDSEAYWLTQFEGDLPILELPTFKTRPQIKTYNGDNYRYTFSRDFSSKLRSFSEGRGVSLFMSLMAGVNGLFSRYSNTGDIILGTPVAGRDHQVLENQIGLYLNTLAIRTQFEEASTFEELLEIQKDTLLSAYVHQGYPLDSLVDKLDIQRDSSRSALFDVMVVLQNQQNLFGGKEIVVEGLEIAPYTEGQRTVSQFDLSFVFTETGDQLSLHLDYNTDIYDAVFAENLVIHLENFLGNCLENADQKIANVQFLTETDTTQLLEEFNNTKTTDTTSRTIIDVFEDQVRKTPNATAIKYNKEQFTYKELDTLSNQMAHYLLSNFELSKEDIVAVKLDRSDWLVVALLAVLKSGCAYVPIDPNYPKERIDFIEGDSNCVVTINDQLLTAFLETKNMLSSKPQGTILPSDLAYIIYTSGSTGKPKGVMIEHKSVINLCFWHIGRYELDTSSRGSLYAGIGFDASVWEIYPYLLSGGSLYPISESEIRYDVNLLADFLNENAITHAYLPTKICEELSIQNIVLNTTKVLTGGEALTLPEGNQNLHIYNNYGPSENTVVTTSFDLQDRDGERIPIGKPVSNTEIYIVSETLELQPVGVVGEICVSGVGLSRGYLNRPELTAEKFVVNRFRESGNLYKTGDLGRWLPDGNIEFVGRKDTQIKIRGYRVELGEIENVLKGIMSIDQAVVIDVDVDGDKTLVAYYVSDARIEKQEIRDTLGNTLPEYMIPSYYLSLDSIPLTANGKLDKKSLPEITQKDLVKNAYVAPKTEIEEQLVAIWEEVLGVDTIGVTDNFFELGGHSLKVTLIVNKIKKELGLELSVKDMFLQPTISGILTHLKESTSVTIPKAKEQESYALTSSQRRLWVLSQFEEGSVAYNIPAAFQLKGHLEISFIKEAFTILITRHESLRTRFMRDSQEELRQYIIPSEAVVFDIEKIDLSIIKDQDIAIKSIIDTNNNYCFDLGEAPLLKAKLIKLTEESHLLVLNMHHIISDGWSMEVLSKEFMMVYGSLVNEESVELPSLSIQYKDYSEWLVSEAQQSQLLASETYWLSQFKGELPILELPTYKTRPKIKTYNGDAIHYNFSKELTTRLKSFSEENEVTLFMVLMAGLNGLFSRYANTRDIILGTPIAGRDHKALENQIGLYLNTLAIRTRFDERTSFNELIAIQKEILLDAYAHQGYPLDSLVDKLDIQHDTSRSALFDVVVVLQNQQNLFGREDIEIKGLEIEPYIKQERTVSQFDLSFVFSETEEHLSLHLDYNVDVYNRDVIQKLVVHLESFLNNCLKNADQNIANISFITKADTMQLMTNFNATKKPYDIDRTIVDVFVNQVDETPDAIAVVHGEKQLTYRELDILSNQMAHYLLSNYELSREDFVGVKLDRDEWLVVTLLSVLKTGCAYVPIDPSYPTQRIEYIEEDSNCVLTIDETFIDSFNATEHTLTSLQEIHISPSSLAYVIYTSGSTGKPKGVMIEHRSVLNLCFWHISEYDVTASSRGSLYAGIGFDASVWEIYPYLVSGASLFPISDTEIRYDVQLLTEFLEDNEITHSYLPTKICEAIATQNIPLIGIKILTGGEALTLPEGDLDVHIYNNYGPSENTVVTTSFDLKDRTGECIPIGKPVSNTEIYIVSEALELQPVGVVGEICVSGVGLSRGYLNRPELTAEKFVVNRFRESGNLYKTGDLGRWLPDGTIEFIGRKDHQVKIRGYRIELGEIENTLVTMSSINQAVVVVSDVEGDATLVAYYTSDEIINKQELRDSLSNELPDYMVPSYYIHLETIPLTANGKVDKKALPEIVPGDLIRNEYVAPITEIEKQLVAIWEEVLGMDTIGVTDNFFELGGHSLKVTLIVNKIKKELELELSVKEMFLQPTISGIITHLKKTTQVTIPKVELQESYALTSSQRRLWVLSQFKEGNTAYNIPAVFALKGNLDVSLIRESFSVLIERHESLRTRFMRDDQDEIRQYIVPSKAVVFSVEEVDLSTIDDQDSVIRELLQLNNNHCFDLSVAPLITASLIKREAEDHLLVLNMHHIISDGWSMEVLSREFTLIYGSLVEGKSIALPSLPIQYKDYAEWLASEGQQSQLLTSEAYWLSQFEGELPVLELPTFKTRPQVKTYYGDYYEYTFSKKVVDQIRVFSENNDASLFMTLMAGINGLFSRYANTRDIILGTPVAGRDHQVLENQIGLYLNTLAIRTRFEEETSFNSLLDIQKHTLLDAYAHQVYPLDSLVEKLDLRHDTSRSALFDVIVVFQNQQNLFGAQEIATTDIEILPYTKEHRNVSQFDISFIFSDHNEELSLHIEYNTDIYDIAFIERITTHLENFIKESIENPNTSITEVSYITELEKQQLLHDFNQTQVTYPKNETIVELFVEQVKKTPESIALIFEREEYTYKDLDEVSTKLANYLLKYYDCKPEDFVGIKLDNSEWQIIAILAILKIGCAYVPIDTSYPEQRITYIEKDSNCRITINESVLQNFNKEVGLANTLPTINYTSDHLAYVMYTSGSTGNPKGVMVEHKSVVRLVKSSNFYQCSISDVLLSTGAFSFDATTFEYWGPLLNGGCLVLCPKDTLLDSDLLSHKIKEKNVNVMWFTAGWLQMLVDTAIDLFAPLSTVLAGGDKLSPKHIAILKETYPTLEIINGYGPTENTTFSLTYTIPEVVGDIPIGYPINNSTAYILSDHLDVQPIGVVGEICLGGDGLSRGYLNRPGLTAEKFVKDRFRESKILYKTGDLGRWLPDGRIEFMGRKDNQVKLRGYRIELGEIETALLSYKEIPQAVVVIKEVNGSKEIVAYLVSEFPLDKELLRTSLRTVLPDYMLPSYFVVLDKMPLNSNGKIAIRLLPEVTEKDIVRKKYVAPNTDLEIKLAKIWQDVLGVERVGVTDDFFELGGHSLKASKLLSDYQRFCDVKIEMQRIFDNTTIETHCALIEKAQKVKFVEIPRIPIATSYPVSNTQKKMWIASQYDKGSIAYNIPICLELSIDETNFKKAIQDVIIRHEILRTVFKQESEGEIRQYILPPEAFVFEIKTLDYQEEENIEESVRAYVINDLNNMFDLENGPLLRGALLKVSSTNYVFYFNMHHIISDGWSLEVLTKDVLTYYEGYQNNKQADLEKLKIQFKDYVSWVQNDKNIGIHKDYWTQNFSGEIPKINLSIADERPSIKTFDGNSFSGEISAEIFSKLRDKIEASGISLYMNLMGVVNMLLYRYSYQNDIIIGSPFAGRNHPDLKDQIGCYINTIPIKSFIQENKIYDEYLEEVKQTILDAQHHGSYPFDAILEDIDYQRDLSRSPLFDIMVVMIQNVDKEQQVPIENSVLSNFKLPISNSKVDITFFFKQTDDKVLCNLVYNATIFSEAVIEKLFEDFITILEKTVSNTSLSIKDYLESIIDKSERIEHHSFVEELSNSISEDF